MVRQMKDSGIEWIGEIPESWNVCRVKNVANVFTGNSIKDEDKDQYSDEYGARPYISSKDIDAQLNTIDYENGMYTKNEDDTFKVAQKGSTLMCIEGGSAGVKKAFLKREVSFVNKLCCFEPENVDKKYLYYSLMNPCFEDEFQKHISGLIGGVSVSALKNFAFLNPTINEQQKIADFLDAKVTKIDEAIDKTRKTIEEYKALKQSIITQAVTKGVRGDRPMKDSGIEWIGAIPEEWGVKRFKYVAPVMFKGSGITKEDVVPDGEIPCVRYGEIYTKYQQTFVSCITRTNIENVSSPQYFESSDLLFVCTGELVEEIGKSVAYVGNEKCLAGGDIIVARHNENAGFLNYAMNSSYAQNQKSCSKTKLKVVHISASEIGNVRIALPELDEQKEIAEYLDQKCVLIDTSISKKEQLVSELESYKKSLIYEYVTGKKEVPGYGN